MSVNRLSIHSIGNVVQKVPCETSIRHHLSKFDLSTLESANSRILTYAADSLQKKGKKYQFAIDLTNDLYYGKIVDTNADYVIRSRPKKSTTYFYSYVSIYIIRKRERLTLAVFPVKKGVKMVEYVRKCMETIQQLDINVEVLCLDRGFYSKEVFRFLHDEGIPHIVPVKKHSVETKTLLNGKKARFAQYTMKGEGKPLKMDVAIDVHYQQGKMGKYGNVNLGYVVHGLDWTPRRIYNTYKTRFAIEASYRIRNSVKCKTSSRNVTVRYLHAIISLLLKNIWVVLQRIYFSPIKRGPRTVEENLFRFDQFRMLVWEGIRKVLRPVTEIPVLRSSV
ncbi:ISH3 family transposase [Methanogenium marinum]|uniref:ISH3 family transposase n=2 Tax=Methanogenium marinum TaxID=348610 RepID=A0A9Q4KRP9_9EURY|nr:ISH3 family transposase [Methanogenium marinum]